MLIVKNILDLRGITVAVKLRGINFQFFLGKAIEYSHADAKTIRARILYIAPESALNF